MLRPSCTVNTSQVVSFLAQPKGWVSTGRLVLHTPLILTLYYKASKGRDEQEEEELGPVGRPPTSNAHRELNKPFGGAPTHSDENSMA